MVQETQEQEQYEKSQFGSKFKSPQNRRLIFQVDEGHNSKETADKYRNNFRLFLNFIKIHDLDVLLDLGKEAIQELVIKYAKSMRDDPIKKYKRGTVHSRIATILYFFDNNDIELNRRKIRRYYPPDESTNDDRPYSHEEIARILSVCDLRTRAMILLMASTGMRIGALHLLRIDDLTKIPEHSMFKVQVYARTRDRYFTFCTPECAKVIDEYLDYRKRCDETLKDESPLFRRQGFNRFTINKPLFISQSSVMDAIDDAIQRAGCKSKKVMRSHAFRKGFKSICEQSGMKSINIELLLGHDIGLGNNYYRPTSESLLEDYMKAVDALTIDPNNRLKARVKQLESVQSQEIAQLKERVQFLDEHAHRWARYARALDEGRVIKMYNKDTKTKARIFWPSEEEEAAEG